VSPVKTAEPVEMPFGLWAQVGSRNHVLDEGPDPPMGRGNFLREKGRPIVKYRTFGFSCAKTAEPIKMTFGTLGRVDPGNHVLDGGTDVPMGRGTFRGVSGPLHSIGFWGLGKKDELHKNS